MSSLEAARSVGDSYHVGWALHTLGQSDVAIGDPDAAARHLRESLDILLASGDMSAVALLLIDGVLVDRRHVAARVAEPREVDDHGVVVHDARVVRLAPQLLVAAMAKSDGVSELVEDGDAYLSPEVGRVGEVLLERGPAAPGGKREPS